MSNGFSELNNYFKKLEKNAKELENTKSVSFETLFNSKFMSKYTRFSSFNELLTFGKYEVNSQEDFEAIPDDEFDDFIASNTKFETWQDMLDTASTEYAINKLGL